MDNDAWHPTARPRQVRAVPRLELRRRECERAVYRPRELAQRLTLEARKRQEVLYYPLGRPLRAERMRSQTDLAAKATEHRSRFFAIPKQRAAVRAYVGSLPDVARADFNIAVKERTRLRDRSAG